jgi:hypothetical protein
LEKATNDMGAMPKTGLKINGGSMTTTEHQSSLCP